jgi:hypothetical protein
MAEDDDFDMDLWQYDYWMDIDYASDGDEIRQRQHNSRITRKKRKLLAASGTKIASSQSKRRKVLPAKRKRSPTGRVVAMNELPLVIKMKRAVDQRYEPQEIKVVDTLPLKASSLFGDWREKFANTPMWAHKKPAATLEEVEDAPDDDGSGSSGTEVVDDARALLQAGTSGDLEEDGWEDEEDEEDEEEGGDGPMDLDPEALKMAIQQNLASAGINTKGLDEQTLMSFAMKMFAGGGEGGDDLIGELTDQLLGGRKVQDDEDENEEEDAVTEDEEAGFAGWVQKQAKEKAAKKDSAELPTPADSYGKPSASPPDKREKAKTADAEAGAEIQRGRKRKADGPAEAEKPKRPARRFDAPTAASKARSAVPAPATRRGRKG